MSACIALELHFMLKAQTKLAMLYYVIFLKHLIVPKCQGLAPAVEGADHKNHLTDVTSGQTQLMLIAH